MTTGMMLALLAGLLWSVTNILDKTIVSKYLKEPRLIFIPMSAVYCLVGGAILVFRGEGLSFRHLAIALIGGCFWILMNYLYFQAARLEEISRVVPLFALDPMFVTIFGALLLGEIFIWRTYFGIAIIISGAFLIMLKGSIAQLFQTRAYRLMVWSAMFASGHAILLKYLLRFGSFWTVFGWVTFLGGLIGLVVFSRHLKEIATVVSAQGWKGVWLVGVSEVNSTLATFVFTVAASLWFVSLVASVVTIQYLFVFIWTLLLSSFFPHVLREETHHRIAIQKIIAIILIIGGVFLLS